MRLLKVLATWPSVVLLAICAFLFQPTPATAAGPPDDPAELEAFLDGFMASAMDRYHVPGLVFVMVKDGQVFLSKGYGYANIAGKRPVDPETTLFRVASVSKLFTGTAVMQLVEQGKLDLHQDVNVYLKGFQLPAVFPEPVTPLNLLTHTAGFDERVFGMEVRRREDMRPLGEYLAARMPARVLPPGDVFSYSNHGVALAGLIVQNVSGLPFETYVEQNIFTPLSMNHSSFVLTPELQPFLAQGYYFQNHKYQLAPYDFSNDAPAGSLITCGADMSRFMLAHLQDGRLGDARILSEETARLMHTQQFTHHPKLAGCAVSFMEDFVNGRRLIGHGGNWRGYTSRLVLDPAANFGFFLSYNALSSSGRENWLHEKLVQAFYDRYFPVPETLLPKPAADAAKRAPLFAGYYRPNRYIRGSFGKLAALLSEWRVVANTDGTLTAYLPGHEPVRLTEVEPLLFIRDDTKGYVAFRADSAGRITHMFIDTTAADKLPTIETARFNSMLLGLIILIFLSALLVWPIAYFLKGHGPRAIKMERAARWFASASILFFLISLGSIGAELSGDIYEYAYGVPGRVALLLRLQYLVPLLVFGMVAFAVTAWRKNWWNIWGRIHYSIIALAALTLVPVLLYWRVLGFGY